MLTYIIPFLLVTILAVIYEATNKKNINSFYGIAHILLGLWGGLRFQIGQDWHAYQSYFDIINIKLNPIDAYAKSLIHFQFEIGYFFFNYIVKFVGGNCSIIFLIASVFCSYSVYRFTCRFDGNKFYILTIYMGYSFLLLHFAQVRQSIAIAFFLLGCDLFLKNEKKVQSIIICSIGLLFQYSCLIYVLLLLITFFYSNSKKLKFFSFGFLPILYVCGNFFNFFDFIKLISPASLEAKILWHKTGYEGGGSHNLTVYGIYLLLCSIYLAFYSKDASLPHNHKFVCDYAVYSLLITVLLIFIFPSNYVMYSRMYVLACLFQGYAASLIFNLKKLRVHHFFFITSNLMTSLYYFHILLINKNVYIPYRFYKYLSLLQIGWIGC